MFTTHKKVLEMCRLIRTAPLYTVRPNVLLYPKKDYNCPFFHLAHFPSSVTSESRVYYSRPPAVCLLVSVWLAFILLYDQTGNVAILTLPESGGPLSCCTVKQEMLLFSLCLNLLPGSGRCAVRLRPGQAGVAALKLTWWSSFGLET
jgi:hypothetical protein